MAFTVNLKIYFTKDNSQNENNYEIRRCTVEYTNDAVNFTQLYEKIKDLFPDIKAQHFTIAWKDSDGDYITISSTEELKIALSEMQNIEALYKLYVTLHSVKKQEPNISTDNVNAQSNIKAKHFEVICDICDKDIIGFRYKCVQCLNYDLCSDCERKGHHAEHCVLRVPVPLQFKTYYERKLLHLINKFINKASAGPKNEFNPENESKECGYTDRYKNTYKYHHQTPSWINTFTTHLHDWANFIGEVPVMAEYDKKGETNSNKNFGSADAGKINVNVQMKSRESSETANANEENNSKININEQDVNVVKQSSEVSSSEEIINIGHKEMESKLTIDTENIQIEDWTILDKDTSSIASISSNNSDKQETSSVTENNKISNSELPDPNLPEEYIWHPDPHIQGAFENMLEMGFSNENGLLMKLLISKQGNIDHVLDLIHKPV